MLGNACKVWKLSITKGAVALDLPDTSTLDMITRQLPEGYYSTFRTFDGCRRVLGLRTHLQRIYQPAAVHKINPAVPITILRSQIADILGDCPSEVRVRLVMTTRGEIYLATTPLTALPSEVYQYGVKVMTTDMQRESPRVKSTAFIAASENTRSQIAQSEVFEALLVRNNSILEGMTSNFFYVSDGVLGTACKNILLGVTRRTVIRVARGSGLSIVYRALKRELVPELSEAFLTSSSRGIVPIAQVDGIAVGEGTPGLITKNLIDRYLTYVMQHAEIV